MTDPILDKVAKIRKFYREHKIMPTYEEICELVGFKSKNAAFKLADKLVDLGFVEKMDKGRLKPGPHFLGTPLYNSVSAGPATAEEETLIDHVDLNEMVIRNPEKTVLINVRGDSMEQAGIMEGDKVAVEVGSPCRLGDIVVANVDGGFTVKFLDKTPDGRPLLVAANPKYEPFSPTQEMKIFGRVVGVIRKV